MFFSPIIFYFDSFPDTLQGSVKLFNSPFLDLEAEVSTDYTQSLEKIELLTFLKYCVGLGIETSQASLR